MMQWNTCPLNQNYANMGGILHSILRKGQIVLCKIFA